MTIAQSSDINTPIVNVTAIDNDEENTPNSEIVFSLEDTALPFQIDSSSGLLTTRSIIPELRAEIYNVVVIVADNGNPSLSSNGTVVVDVAAPNSFDPVFLDNLAFSITENNPSSEVLFRIQVTDDDIDNEGEVNMMLLPTLYSTNFTLTNTGSNSASIAYLGGSGFDRETVTNFSLSVQATDQGNPLFRRTSQATVYVTVEDVNDNPPVFLNAPYSAMVSENAMIGLVIATVEASDADEATNNDVVYSSSFSGDEFVVDSISGNITVAGDLLVARQAFFQIPITASDGVFDTLTFINITVLEVNDNSPQFVSQPPALIILSEDTEVNSVFLNVTVSDADTGINGEVSLTIMQDRDTFLVSSYPEVNEFYISLNRELDFEVR